MTKSWYTSKIVWLGVITTAIGVLEVLNAWLETTSFTVQDFITLSIGVLVVVLRIWFTDTKLTG